MAATPQAASKLFRTVRTAISMSGIWDLLAWLLLHASKIVTIENQPRGTCIGILHKDSQPQNDEYIIIDLQVMGRSVFVGWIQIL